MYDVLWPRPNVNFKATLRKRIIAGQWPVSDAPFIVLSSGYNYDSTSIRPPFDTHSTTIFDSATTPRRPTLRP